MNTIRRWTMLLGVAGAFAVAGAHASVTINGTRLVYPQDQREITVKLNNDSRNPSLVQVWMDEGNADAKPDQSHAPFVVTPPIFRMDAGKSQTLRVMLGSTALPQDRESVFWLNVLDVPPRPEAKENVNTLQLAYRTRIKVFVRPSKLPGKPEDAPRALEWKAVPASSGAGQSVSVSNASAYYVSFSEISVSANGRVYKNEHGGMVAPHAKQVIDVPQMNGVHGGKVHYMAINDFGGAIEGDANLGE